MGTTLRFLEEGTPWTNKAKLYTGIMKEVMRKDMKTYNFPLVFGTTASKDELISTT